MCLKFIVSFLSLFPHPRRFSSPPVCFSWLNLMASSSPRPLPFSWLPVSYSQWLSSISSLPPISCLFWFTWWMRISHFWSWVSLYLCVLWYLTLCAHTHTHIHNTCRHAHMHMHMHTHTHTARIVELVCLLATIPGQSLFLYHLWSGQPLQLSIFFMLLYIGPNALLPQFSSSGASSSLGGIGVLSFCLLAIGDHSNFKIG